MVPFVLLLAALVLAPVIGGAYGELANGILQILVFAAVCEYALFGRRSERKWYRAPGAAALGVLVVASLASLIFSESLFLSLKQVMFGLACLGGYFLAASMAKDNKAAVLLVCGVVLAGLWICAMDIREYALSTGGGASFWAAVIGEQARRQGGFISPNYFAAFLVTVLPVSLALYLAARRNMLALVFGLAFAVQVASLGMTGSKAGTLAATAALMAFLLLAVFSRCMGKQQFVRLLVLAVLIAPVVLVFSGNVEKRVQAAKVGGAQAHTESHRIATWKGTLRMIKANPWVGVGPGAFEIAFPRYAVAGHTAHAHESYLQVAAESGVLALAALLIGFAAIGWAGLRSVFTESNEEKTLAGVSEELGWEDIVPAGAWRTVSCGLVGAFVGSLIANLVDSGWYVIGVALPFCVMAGVMVGRVSTVRREIELGRAPRLAIAGVCGVGMVISASFGLGNMFAPDDMSFGESPTLDEIRGRYESAAMVSPLNPEYQRELGKLLVDSNPKEAMARAERAIRLAPMDAESYYVRGIIARRVGEMDVAVKSFGEALKLKPHSTQVLYDLAMTYYGMSRKSDFESTLRRLIAIETTDYEKVTGVPEMVDTRYARAHAYFGQKYLADKKYAEAASEFEAAVGRLERWRSYGLYIQIAKATGKLTETDEQDLFGILRDSYYGLADAYNAMGKAKPAAEARQKAEEVPDKLPDDQE